MTRVHLIELIEKYLNAETSLEEESILRQEIQYADVPEEFEYLKEVFSYFDSEKATVEIPSFDNPAESGTSRRKIIPLSWFYAAASVVILIGVFIFLNRDHSQDLTEDTFQTPDIAAENAAQALEYFSYQMKKGTEPTLKNVKELDNLNKYLSIFN